MDYAASKQFVSPRGVSIAGDDSAALCWELDEGVTAARQETWLLSFIDILALLLTLLVLLLAYQDQDRRLEQELAAGAAQKDTGSAVVLQTPLTAYNGPRLLPPALDAPQGYAVPRHVGAETVKFAGTMVSFAYAPTPFVELALRGAFEGQLANSEDPILAEPYSAKEFGISNVGLSVKNIEKAIAFYRDVVGMEKVLDREVDSPLARIVGIEGAKARIVHMKLGEALVELFDYQNPKGRDPRPDQNQSDYGLTHIGFMVEDFWGTYQHLLNHGVEFLGEPVEIRPGVFVGYFRGVEYEVCEIREIVSQ